jgi:hypothetical protein
MSGTGPPRHTTAPDLMPESSQIQLAVGTASNQLKKGGELQYMRIIAIITLAAAAISLSACAPKEQPSTMTSAKSTYSK